MPIKQTAASSVAVIPVAGPPGVSIVGPAGPRGNASTVPGPPGRQGPAGAGTVVTAFRGGTVLPSTYVVQIADGTVVTADPTNVAHQGLVVGLDVAGGSIGSIANINTVGPVSNVAGSFGNGDAIWIGDGTTGRVGAPVNAPPLASSSQDIWRQQVGTGAAPGTINGLLGLAYRVRASAVPALVGSGSYVPISDVGRAIVTATDTPKAPTASITEAASAADTMGRIVTAPYLLGLRNKTVNVRRYASVNSAMSDVGDGFTLDVPAGNFQVTGTAGLPISNSSVSVRGEGSGASRFYFPAGSQGLALTQDSYFRTMIVSGLSLHSQGVSTGTALKIARPAALSGIQAGPRLDDLQILGDDPSIHGWSVGIDLSYCWNTILDRLQYQGIDGQTSSTAVIIRGQSTPVTMRAANIVWANRAVWAVAGAFNEGFIAEGCQIVACNEGYVFEDPSNPNQPNGNAPVTEIRGGHSATYSYGVRTVNRNSVKISGHTFYKRPDSTMNWVGVQMSNANNISDVTGCNFFGYKPATGGSFGQNGAAAGGTAIAWVSQGSLGNVFQDSAVIDCDVGVSPVDQAVLVKNNRAHNVTSWANNTPTGSVIEAPFLF